MSLKAVRVRGGNGLTGVCVICEDLVGAFPLASGGYGCGNDHGTAEPTRGRTWTPTKKHTLVPFDDEEAYCRKCQDVVPNGRWQAGRHLVPGGLQYWCAQCGAGFVGLPSFDAHGCLTAVDLPSLGGDSTDGAPSPDREGRVDG